MKTIKFKYLAFIIALALFGVYSCNTIDDEYTEVKSGMGTVTVSLTDAPFPYDLVEEANITIDWIKLHKIDSTEMREGEGADSAFVLFEKDTTINLLDLSNGVTAIMSEMEVPVGTYKEIRIHVVKSSVKLFDDDSLYNLKIPSGSASGIKVKIIPWLTVEEGSESEVLLDFDVSRSFKVVGNKGKKGLKFMFIPVVRAVNLTTAGKIEGIVSNEDGDKIKNAMVTLFSDSDTISCSKSTKDGFYALIGIPEGTYSMECEREGYEIGTAENVVVEIGKITEQNFVLK